MTDEMFVIRKRAHEGKSLTGRQAKLLLEDRELHFKLLLGSQYALMGLRAFMADDAPEWARARVKAAMDTNPGILAEYERFKNGEGQEQNQGQ